MSNQVFRQIRTMVGNVLFGWKINKSNIEEKKTIKNKKKQNQWLGKMNEKEL